MKLERILHGGDYNPEQWLESPEILAEDLRLMKLAHVNAVSVGIFSWAMLEPAEGRYEFAWLDRVLDSLHKTGVRAILATPTGAKPNWMAAQYPEICRVLPNGQRELQQSRHNHCLTSPVYREKAQLINARLAERYRNHPAVLLWHVSNEYGGECHCDLCKQAFRQWLQRRYGALDAVNRAWWTRFWSHTFTDWMQINAIDDSVHGLTLDWKRFVTDQTANFLLAEMAPLRQFTPHVPITINMMGIYPHLNYWKIAPHLDLVSWDSYPDWHGAESDATTACWTAFTKDIYRALKPGTPWLLMESTTSNVNWKPLSRPKLPGMHRLTSLQAVAHGSDSVLYFQWRKSRGSSEKFHGAVIDHVGHEHTRVFREVAALGKELATLPAGTTTTPEVGLIFDWENRWAIEMSHAARNRGKDYEATCVAHYRPLWEQGVPVDVIDMEQDFAKYRLLIAPMLHMVRPGVAERIDAFVKAGGTFVATYLTGYVNESDLCFLGGFPGPLRKVLGIWAEELDVPESQTVRWRGKTYQARQYCEIIHAETATVLAKYGREHYAGRPAVTVNRSGQGRAYFIASRNDEKFLADFTGQLVRESKVKRSLDAVLPAGVTAQRRGRQVFVMNFNAGAKTVRLKSGKTLKLAGYDCKILTA